MNASRSYPGVLLKRSAITSGGQIMGPLIIGSNAQCSAIPSTQLAISSKFLSSASLSNDQHSQSTTQLDTLCSTNRTG